MKLKNCVVGQRVQIKELSNTQHLAFCRAHLGRYATIINEPDRDGDLTIRLDNGHTDIGHHTNLRKIKE